MRKLAVLCSVGLLMLVLAACGGDGNGEQTGENDGTQMQGEQGKNGQQSGTDGYEGDLQAVKAALAETLGAAYLPDEEIGADVLADKYGITSDMYDAAFAERATAGEVDILILVLAKEGQADTVEEAMNAYRELKVKDTAQSPKDQNKVRASRIERIGNYVCYVQLGAGAADGSEGIDEEIIMRCQEQNELAIAVIEQNVRHY